MGAGPPREQESGGRPRPALQPWPKSHRDPAARLPPRLPPPGRSARPPHASATSPVSGAGVPRCSRRDPGGCGPAWPAPCLRVGLRPHHFPPGLGQVACASPRHRGRAAGGLSGFPDGSPTLATKALQGPSPDPTNGAVLMPHSDRPARSGQAGGERGQGQGSAGEVAPGARARPRDQLQPLCTPADRQAGTGHSSITGPLRVVPQHLEPQPLAQALSRGPSQQTEAGEHPGAGCVSCVSVGGSCPPPEHPAPQALRPHTSLSPKEPSCAAAALAEVKVTDGDRGPERPLKCHPR